MGWLSAKQPQGAGAAQSLGSDCSPARPQPSLGFLTLDGVMAREISSSSYTAGSRGSTAILWRCSVLSFGLCVCRNLSSGWEPANVHWDQMHESQGTTLWVTSLLLRFICVLGIKSTLSGVHSKYLYPPNHLVGPQGIFPEHRHTCACMCKYICL